MKFPQIERERGNNNFSAASRGDKKFNRVFHPVSTTPPPRELKNDNSLTGEMQLQMQPYNTFMKSKIEN